MSDLIDVVRNLEASMSKAQLEAAFAIMRANGWPPGSTPPAWVWLQVFRMAIAASKGTGDE